MSRFAGQVAWITGGGTGIGRALALALAREGARVVVSGRREGPIQEVAEAAGGGALALVCDVVDDAQVEATVAEIVSRLGRLDLVVANAGFAVGGRVAELGAEDWRRQLDVNVLGLVSTCRHAIPHLKATRGRLALMGSGAAFFYAPGTGAYAASKAAVHAIGTCLWAELKAEGVSVTTLHPGFIESEIGRVDNQGRHHPERQDKRPAALMWRAEPAAKAMLRAIHARRREATITGHAALIVWLGRHLSWFTAWLALKAGAQVKKM